MYENVPASYPPSQPPAPGVGCVAKGCLTLLAASLLLLLIAGGICWYVARDFFPFFSQEPVAVRIFPATDAQYRAVELKLGPFMQAVKAGQSATVTLTADDINTLIARDPQETSLRGKVYLTIVKNELSTDVCFPLKVRGSPQQKWYFDGRVSFDASFAGGEFALVLRKIAPLDGSPTPPMAAWLIGQDSFTDSFNRGFNDGFRNSIKKNPAATDLLARLHTVIVADNQIIATAEASSAAVAAPANSP